MSTSDESALKRVMRTGSVLAWVGGEVHPEVMETVRERAIR